MTEFAVWAPELTSMHVLIAGIDRAMDRDDDGWWRAEVPDAGPGTDYAFLLEGGDQPLPDPRSRWQPAGVHGLSRVYDDAAFASTDQSWTGRQVPGSVVYKLHVGTFTPEGTFDAALERLDHLIDLGVDLVELLPVNAFDGEHNWGYDDVCWYAPHEPYGGPDGLKRFVDACHARGLGVILDIVYNHFGPSGGYPPQFGPYLADSSNPFGRADKLDGPHFDEVRRYIIDSVLMWLRDYHVDGLHLDAVHAPTDHRATDLLEELVAEVEVLSTHVGRPLSLIAESDLNDPRLIAPRKPGACAQSSHESHHGTHPLLSGERQGYHADFGSLECLSDVLTAVFVRAGTWPSFRGRTHGRPVDRSRIAGHRFVAYLRNHEIGNHALGERISLTLSPGLLRVGATLLLTGPFTPTLFMGEEWAAATPWQLFTRHSEPGSAAAVAVGRRREFAAHGWPETDVADPQTLARSRLDWAELDKPEHREMLAFYRRLIGLRRSQCDLSDPRLDKVHVWHGNQFVAVRRGSCVVAANLARRAQRVTMPGVVRAVLLASETGVTVMRDVVELPAESAVVAGLA